MAKAFDLVHKVVDSDEPNSEGRIPFKEDGQQNKDSSTTKKRTRVEMVFFYLLLFAIFFIMGVMFLSPNLFKNRTRIGPAENPAANGETPIPGFTIDKHGQTTEQAAKDLGVGSPSPVTSSKISPSPLGPPDTTAKTDIPAVKTARIEILNGANQTGAAATMQQKLARKGISVENIGNYKKKTVAKTTVYYTSDYKTAASQVLSVTGGIMVKTNSAITGGNDILVVIGKTH